MIGDGLKFFAEPFHKVRINSKPMTWRRYSEGLMAICDTSRIHFLSLDFPSFKRLEKIFKKAFAAKYNFCMSGSYLIVQGGWRRRLSVKLYLN